MGQRPLTPASTRALLDGLGHEPQKKLGQNFLVDGNIVRKSIQLGEVAPGDNVIEIGPGLGTLSRALLEAGATVYAIEYDRRLHANLSQSITSPAFHLMIGDAVDHPLAGFIPRGKDFKIVANLPYAIATPWLEGVLAGPLPSRMVLMLQKEAADRFTAQPGNKTYGAISIFLEAAYERCPGHAVSRQCFYPVPGVDSVLLHLVRRPNPVSFAPDTRKAIRALFTQRRKQIAGLVRRTAGFESRGETWLQWLQANGIDHRERAENLPLPAWITLDKLLSGHQ